MNTVIEHIDSENIDEKIIAQAGECIKRGGLVAFPTETVYGLGGDALNPESSAKIYEAKGRPSDNPLIVHIADMEALDRITTYIPETAYELAERFWPGPLTMIFHKSDLVPERTTGGLDTVAVRFPSDTIARRFIEASGGYIAAPSANISGRPSPVTWEHVVGDMKGRIDMILCGDDSEIGLESTIIDLSSDQPAVLRPGFVTIEELRKILPDTVFDPALMDISGQTRPKAPGMKYRHYAPRGDMYIVEGAPEDVVVRINSLLSDAGADRRTGVICAESRIGDYKADLVLGTGGDNDAVRAAHRLYSLLRKMDDENIDLICAEALDGTGLGAAYMNRLTKAAGGRVIKA